MDIDEVNLVFTCSRRRLNVIPIFLGFFTICAPRNPYVAMLSFGAHRIGYHINSTTQKKPSSTDNFWLKYEFLRMAGN